MKKYSTIPSISGNQLTKLLLKDDWEIKRQATHGRSLTKDIGNIKRVAIIPKTNESLPVGTLMAILGNKQTNIGKKGLIGLLNKYGL